MGESDVKISISYKSLIQKEQMLEMLSLYGKNSSKNLQTSSKGFIDSGSLNINLEANASKSNIVILDGKLYVIWVEETYDHEDILIESKIHVKRYNGLGWEILDGETGLNYNIKWFANSINTIVYENELYVAWNEKNIDENDNEESKIIIKKYNGNIWTRIEDDHIKFNSYLEMEHNPKMTVYKNSLYIIWKEKNTFVIKKYNGIEWITVEQYLKVSDSAKAPNITADDINLYIAWQEYNGVAYQIYVSKFDGVTWSTISGENEKGLNYDNLRSAFKPSMATLKSKLYITWYEEDINNILHIRVKKYNGEEWTFIDGNTTKGINKDCLEMAYAAEIFADKNEIYVLWQENNHENVNSMRVMKYDGLSWSWVDEGGNLGLNEDPKNDAEGINMTAFNNNLYFTWSEFGQIRVKKRGCRTKK